LEVGLGGGLGSEGEELWREEEGGEANKRRAETSEAALERRGSKRSSLVRETKFLPLTFLPPLLRGERFLRGRPVLLLVFRLGSRLVRFLCRALKKMLDFLIFYSHMGNFEKSNSSF